MSKVCLLKVKLDASLPETVVEAHTVYEFLPIPDWKAIKQYNVLCATEIDDCGQLNILYFVSIKF